MIAARRAIPRSVETKILVSSRRRCCICFGLNRSTEIVQGQLAHLDRDPSNHSEDNLAFLCLAHHDEYDSRKSQSKGLATSEVKHYRDELYKNTLEEFSLKVHFGVVNFPVIDPFAGKFVRVSPIQDSAEIYVTPIHDTGDGKPQYHVGGFALWGESREYGPNIGELSVCVIMNERAEMNGFQHTGGGLTHTVEIQYEDDQLRLVEENYHGLYGANVTFSGAYKKVREEIDC